MGSPGSGDADSRGERARYNVTVFPLLTAAFFLSGAAALIYQVLWLRLLGLVFGVTVYAASTVWAAFMAGLALGSGIAGLAGDRVRRPLVWFAAAEVLTALTAVLTPTTISALLGFYVDLAPSMPKAGEAAVAVRFAIAFAVLIIPTALMGATMPLVVRSSAVDGLHLGSRAGALYASNTAGAIAGTLAAGLFLIPHYGIKTSFLVAAALNVLVGIAAFVLAALSSAPRAAGAATPATDMPAPAIHPTSPAETAPGQRVIVLIVFAISGFASLALEVVWFRVITLFLRPTVYGYAFMLATLLLGIALGSTFASPLTRLRFDRLLTLALLEGSIAVAALLSFTALGWIPSGMAVFGPAVGSVIGSYLAYQFIVSLAVIFPAALAMGLAFPIGLSVWLGAASPERGLVARRTAVFYSLNLAGAIAGSLVAGFILLPSLGSRYTLVAIAALTLACALILLWWSHAGIRLRLGCAVACALVCGWAAATVPDPFDEYLRQRYPGERIVWRREAVQATVSVHERPDKTFTLNVNGNHQASSGGALPFIHRRIGNLPMAVHRDPRHVLVIGLGGGATAGAVSRHSGVSVDVVELSREVVSAADRFFRPVNGSLLQQPNVRLKVDDGRNYLLLTDARYDIITADVILPIHAGAGNLYSVEYFRLVRRALRSGGLAVQWIAGTEPEYKLIMRTFMSVFPETTLWVDGSLMIGGAEPLQLRRRELDWKLQMPARREMLNELGITNFEKLLSLYRAGPSELRQYVGEGPLLTDDRPLVEYFLSLPRDRQVDLSGVVGDVWRHVDE